MQRFTRWLLAASMTMTAVEAQTPIPPFQGAHHEGFEDHILGASIICLPNGLFGGGAELCTLGGGGPQVHAQVSSMGCTVQPRTGGRFARVLDLPVQEGTDLFFNVEVGRLGGYFTLLNSTTPDFTVTFYSGSTQVTGAMPVSIPPDCQWHWAGWDLEGTGIDRIRFRTELPDGGNLAFDDLQLSPPNCGSSVYCTSKVNSLGCRPTISAAPGCAMPGVPYLVEVHQLLNNRPGILFYGRDPVSFPFQGGFLCVRSPFQRTPVQSTGGQPPPTDCSGRISLDIGTLGLGPGPWYFQAWSRDPGSPSSTSLSDAVLIR